MRGYVTVSIKRVHNYLPWPKISSKKLSNSLLADGLFFTSSPLLQSEALAPPAVVLLLMPVRLLLPMPLDDGIDDDEEDEDEEDNTSSSHDDDVDVGKVEVAV